MPLGILFVDGGKKAVVNNAGYHDQAVSLIDLTTGKLLSSVPFDRSWLGLALAPDQQHILVSGGLVEDPKEKDRYAIHNVALAPAGLVKEGGYALGQIAPDQQFISSILVGKQGTYALNIQTDELLLFKENIVQAQSVKVGYRPYGLALDPSGKLLAVSNWGDKSVWFLDSTTLDVKRKVAVQSHPTALQFAKDGRLFVTNSGANTVSVIANGKVIETIRTGTDRADRIGSTPVALSLDPTGKTLFVANAGNNCVTVVDVAKPTKSFIKGFIPTEKYPTAVAVSPNGKKLLIGTAKGLFGPNAGMNAPTTGKKRKSKGGPEYLYVGNQMAGRLAILDMPTSKQLAAYSTQALDNSPLGEKAALTASERADLQKNAFSKIKHVIYVIKENRTYDQVLGDMVKGNGDPSLTMYGKAVTPNIHRIADTYSLLDNLYTDGDVSQAGHQWTDAAYANDYNEKQWPLNYGDHGEIKSDTRLTSSPGLYLWSLARKHGLKARVYGEYVDRQEDHDSLDDPEVKKDPEKYGYSASFEKIFARGGRDPEKVADFLRELKIAEKTGKWPSVMVMALPEDHTRGLRAGAYTPNAMVGSNDQAVGMLVDGVSHSKFWKDTAIFVIQDDAQDGPDHVDSHRTVGLVVSPYVKRGIVDSTQYSTASMLRTMELILGLPPMTQFDAKATPMYKSFTTKPNFAPYNLVAPQVDLEARNPSGTLLAKRSEKLDFSDIDRADFGELNHILWEAAKPGVPYPAPVHGR